jgi:hypothetical protein
MIAVPRLMLAAACLASVGIGSGRAGVAVARVAGCKSMVDLKVVFDLDGRGRSGSPSATASKRTATKMHHCPPYHRLA